MIRIIRRYALALMGLTLALNITAQEQMMEPLPIDPDTRYGKLDNGLTYYVRHNELPKGQAFFYIAQKVGSVLEEDDQRGLAHFLEHMCFNGTENFAGNEVIRYLETLGVKYGEQLNAYTSVDETVYNIDNVPTREESTIDSVLLILHDWSHNLTLDSVEIDKERGVIHEEWTMRASASSRIFERQLPRLMSDSRPGNRLPIGKMEVVDNFHPSALRAYYEKWYRPDQQAIIVVGDLDVDRTEQKIREIFSPIPMPENAAVREYYGVPDNMEPIVVSDCDKEQTLPVVLVNNKHEDMMPRPMRNTQVYMGYSYLCDMALKMLNERLEEMALDPDASFLQATLDDGDFLLSNVTKALCTSIVPKEGRLSEAVTDVMTEVYRAAEHGFNETEYNRSRTEFLSQMEALYNNRQTTESSSYVNECVSHFLENIPMPGIEMEYQFYNAAAPMLTVGMVNALFSHLVSRTDTNLVVLCMNPDKEGYTQPAEDEILQAIHMAQEKELEQYEDNARNEPLISKLPKKGKIKKEEQGQFGSTILTLSNGVKVIYKKTDFKDNEVLMQAYSPGGTSRYGVEDKYTLRMASALIGASGLGNFTSTELQKALAGIQAGVTSSMGARSEFLSGSAVPKDLRTMFELIYLQFQPLKRDDKAVQSVMQQMALVLRNQSLDPMRALADTIQTTLYGDNPMLTLMKEEDLEKASYDRALEIYADRYADASDFTFLFVGNFDEDSLRVYSTQYLATLPTVKRDDSPCDNHFNIRNGEYSNIFEKKQEHPKCTMVILLKEDMPYTLQNGVVADIMGQVLDMRFIEVIREGMGAAYNVSCDAAFSRKSDGSYELHVQIFAPVKPEMMDTCLHIIVDELHDMSLNGAEDKYISKVKEYLLKTYTENQRENGAWISYLQDYYYNDIDKNTDYVSTVEAVTSEDLARMAAEVIGSGNRMTVVMLPLKE